MSDTSVCLRNRSKMYVFSKRRNAFNKNTRGTNTKSSYFYDLDVHTFFVKGFHFVSKALKLIRSLKPRRLNAGIETSIVQRNFEVIIAVG